MLPKNVENAGEEINQTILVILEVIYVYYSIANLQNCSDRQLNEQYGVSWM